jgi:hypothetical protein
MKKQNWNDCARWTLAILGAFGLALFSLGALACDGVANPPASKPPEEDPMVKPPKISSLTGIRTGELDEIIELTWNDPLPASSFDTIEVTFTPKADDLLPQPITVDKGKKSLEITVLKTFQDYTFTVRAVKGTTLGDGVNKTVKGVTVNIDTAIAASLAAATGAGTLEEPAAFKITSADLSLEVNIGKVMAALNTSDKAYFTVDLATNNTSVGWGAMTLPGQAKVVALTLPDGVTSITDAIGGAAAFASYTNLAEITGKSVVVVGAQAFKAHPKLAKATFPVVETINASAFEKCLALTEVSFDKVTEVKASGFAGCANLATIALPALTTIGESAFAGCALQEANFPLVDIVSPFAFDRNIHLTTLVFTNATKIGRYAFRDCRALVTIPETAFPSVTTTDATDAFRLCTALTEVHFPALKVLGGYEFIYDYNLAIVDIPLLEEIGIGSFSYCESLTAAGMNIPLVTKLGEKVFSHRETTAAPAFIYTLPVGDVDPWTKDPAVTLPDSHANDLAPPAGFVDTELFKDVETISAETFARMPSLTSVDLPKVTTILPASGSSLTWDPILKSTNITSVKMPLVTAVHASMFTNRPLLEEVDISGVTGAIPANFFKSCAALKTVNIASATSIANTNAFSGCAALETLIAPRLTAIGNLSISTYKAKLATLDISGVTALAANAVKDCPNLASVKLGITDPSNVDAAAFSGTTAETVASNSGTLVLLVPESAEADYAAWLDGATNKERITIETYEVPEPPAPPAVE